LTILGRAAYRGEVPDAGNLKATNEMLHIIAAKLIGLQHGKPRFEDESFLRSLKERAGPLVGPDLDWAIEDSLRAVHAATHSE
jgi:hypothetical protein